MKRRRSRLHLVFAIVCAVPNRRVCTATSLVLMRHRLRRRRAAATLQAANRRSAPAATAARQPLLDFALATREPQDAVTDHRVRAARVRAALRLRRVWQTFHLALGRTSASQLAHTVTQRVIETS